MRDDQRGASTSRILVGVFVGLLAIGVLVLRQTTMSVHRPVDPDSVLVVEFRSATYLDADPADRLTRAQVDLCVAEATPHVAVDHITVLDPGGDDDLPNYRFTTRPGLDAPDRDQLNGCLEDLRLRHLKMSVTSMSLQVDGREVAGFDETDQRVKE